MAKYNARQLKSNVQKSMKNLTQEEMSEMLGYCVMRVAELEMLFDVIFKKKILDKKDFEASGVKLEKNMNDFLKKLNNRKKLTL